MTNNSSEQKVYLSRGLEYLVLFFGIFFAWNQVGFQFNLYIGSDVVTRVILYFSLFFAFLIFILGFFPKVSKSLFYFVFFYILVGVLFFILSLAEGLGELYRYLGIVLYGVAMLWVIRDFRVLKRFIIVNFLLGIILINLNSITLLHWYKIIELPHQSVERVGGKNDGSEAHLDPYSFGVLGRTENHIHYRNFIKSARLQGWSSEPLHWAYFVFWTLICALLLLLDTTVKKQKQLLYFSIGTILFHLPFLQSASANIVFVSTLLLIASTMLFTRLRFISKKHSTWFFLTLILIPGMILPFGMILMENVIDLFLTGDFLGEGGNWKSKVSFLKLGSDLWWRFIPNPGGYETTAHNLILEKYIQGGYIFIFPLLLFFYFFLKHVVIPKSMLFSFVIALTVLVNTLGVPTAFFTSFGIMWFSTVYAYAYYYRKRMQVIMVRDYCSI